MMMSRIMICLDNLRSFYFNQDRKFIYFKTNVGKLLLHLITDKDYLGYPLSHVALHFAYPEVPKRYANRTNKRVSKTELFKYHDRLIHYIKQVKPDLIIGMGSYASQLLLDQPRLKDVVGKTVMHSFANQPKIPVMITYNLESIGVTHRRWEPIASCFVKAKNYLNKSVVTGINMKHYKYITDFDKVRSIFKQLSNKNKYPIVAVDTETNSLKPWCKGSKIIVFSLSWKRGYGVCIPFKHKHSPWNNNQIEKISKWLCNLMMSDRYKVLHNGKYDIKMMMMTIGLPYAKHCVDTMIMQYVGVDESRSTRRGLKKLAEQYTSMGNYSAPLQTFKKRYTKHYNHNQLVKYNKSLKTSHPLTKKDLSPLVNDVDGSSFNYEWIPIKLLAPYAAMDTDATLRLYYYFARYIIRNKKWIHLIFKYYPALTNVLARIEANGMHLDIKRAKTLINVYKKSLNKLATNLRSDPNVADMEDDRKSDLMLYYKERAKPNKERNKDIISKYRKLKGPRKDPDKHIRFNPDSSNDVKELLFEYCGYQLPYNTEFMTRDAFKHHISSREWGNPKYFTGGKKAIVYIRDHYHSKVCTYLLKYRKYYKLLKDFIMKLPEMVDDNDIIHPEFMMTSTVTSRLASKHPNAQNIPARTDNPHQLNYYYGVKSLFNSRFKNGILVNADYKSLEVFIAALISHEHNLIQPLMLGLDIHKYNACMAFHLKPEQVTHSIRQRAKKTTFGVLYGITPKGLSLQVHSSEETAANLLNNILDANPRLKKAIQDTHNFAKQHHYVETLFGFRRRLNNINSFNRSATNRAIRQSFNAIVQGSASYLTNLSLILLDELLNELHLKSRIITTVHDSILIDTPPKETNMVSYLVKFLMENLPLSQLYQFSMKGYKVPKLYQINSGKYKGHFRYPMTSDITVGVNYNDLAPLMKEPLIKYGSYLKYVHTLSYITSRYKSMKDYVVTCYDRQQLDELQEYDVISSSKAKQMLKRVYNKHLKK